MSKHTPGPWTVDDKQARYVYIKTVSADLARLDVLQNESTEAQLANARIIAAAPEMLEALEVVKECLRSIDVDVMGRSCRREFEKADAYIDDAIAKARGES